MQSNDPLIAVVDDESPMRTMLGRVLRLADYRVDTFANGADFLASLDTRRPDCVVLDIHMPGLSGFEVQLRMQAADIRIPVVFITASDDASLARRAQETGAVCLLRKPFSSEGLLDAIRPHGGQLENEEQAP